MFTPNFFLVLAGALVATRVTRLLTADRVTAPARDRVIARYGMGHWFTYFVHCPWCVGWWVSVAVGVAVWFTAPGGWPVSAWWGVPALVCGFSWLCGLTEHLVDTGQEV